MKKWFIVNLVKLSDELNMIEKSEELPCSMNCIWNLLEKASGTSVIDDRTSDIRKKLRVNINVVKEKMYYYTRLNKKQREYLIELIEEYEAGN